MDHEATATLVAQTPAADLYSALEELVRAQREAGVHMARLLDWPRAGIGVVRVLALCGPVQLGDVAARLRVDVSVASRQVSQLVDAGYVRRTVDVDDRRARVIELTEAGHALLEQMAVRFGDLLKEVFAGWSEQELDDAARNIRRVAAAITAAHDHDHSHDVLTDSTHEEGTN